MFICNAVDMCQLLSDLVVESKLPDKLFKNDSQRMAFLLCVVFGV